MLGPRRPKLSDRLAAVAQTLRDRLPATLYHYTSAAGLKGIVETGQLWAGNVRYLNDTVEVLIGIRQVREILKAYRRRRPPPEKQAFLEHLWSYIPILENVADRVYVVCFCAKDDLLGQWRGYANMGGGYSIGFDPVAMDTHSDEEINPTLRRVIYDLGRQRMAIRDVLDEVYAWIDSPAKKKHIDIEAAADQAIIELFGLVSAFKDPSFETEQEWRIVYSPPIRWLANNLRFIDYGAWLKPYIVVEPRFSKRLPIISVTCGPSLSAELSTSAVRLLLQRHGYLPFGTAPSTRPAVDVRASTVPFRFSR